jgi:transposase InsO family protein
VDHRRDQGAGASGADPGGPYGRRKMTALIRRTVIPAASRGAVDRAMHSLGLSGVCRDKGVRTTIPAKDGIRAGDLLNRDFTAPRPDHTWVMDFAYVRTWAGWVYVAFIVDVYSQRTIAWHAQTSKHVELVMIPLRMGSWERGRQGHPIQPQQLRAHDDANPLEPSSTPAEERNSPPGSSAPGCVKRGRWDRRGKSRPHMTVSLFWSDPDWIRKSWP